MNRVFLTIPKGTDRKKVLSETLKNLKKKRIFLYSLTDSLAVAFENPPPPDIFSPFALFSKLLSEKEEFFAFGTTNITGKTLLITLSKDSEKVHHTELPPEPAALAAAVSDAGFPSQCFYSESDETAKRLAERAKKELEGNLEFVEFVPIRVTTDELAEEFSKLEKIDFSRVNRLFILALAVAVAAGVILTLKHRKKEHATHVVRHPVVRRHKPAVPKKSKPQTAPVTPTVPVEQLANLMKHIEGRVKWFQANDRSAFVIVTGTSCPNKGRKLQATERFVMCSYSFKPESKQGMPATPVVQFLKGQNIAGLLKKLKGARTITGIRRNSQWLLIASQKSKKQTPKNQFHSLK